MTGKGGGSPRGLRSSGSRIRTLVGLALLGLAGSSAVIQACTRVDVVAVEISSVTITPVSVVVVPGETRALSVEVIGDGGRSLPLSTVTWSSDDPSIASVTSAGVVRGVTQGTTRIRAEASGVSGTATVTVQAPPSIVVQADAPDLVAAFEGPDPDPVEIDVTNGGGGTLGDLSVSVTYQEGTGGWLTPRLTSSTAPTTLVLTASTGDLAVGRYRATVHLMAPAAENSPFSIPVTLEVTDARPFLRLIPSAVGFAAVAEGRPPADQVVRVTNAGGGELDGLGATVEYVGDGDWLELDLSSVRAPADLTLGVDPAGLPPGQYAADVIVTSPVASNSPREVTVSLSIEAEAVADLSVEKTGLGQALVDDTVVFQLTLRNAGPRQATAVTLVDSVPAGLEIVQPVGASVTGRRVAWSLGEVLSGESVERTLVTVARELGTSSNVARASSETTDPDAANDRSVFAVQVAPRQTDLSLDKSGPTSAEIGQTIEYVVTVTNAGPVMAIPVVVTDSLPEGMTFLSATDGGTADGRAVRWEVDTLGVGASVEFGVEARVDVSGTLTNVARVASETDDSDPDNDRDVLVTSVDRLADVSVAKEGPASAVAGDTIDYTLTVENLGPDSAAAVVLQDSLPDGTELVSASDEGTVSEGVVSWPAADLEAGESRPYSLRVALSPSLVADVTNRATVTASTEDRDPDNDRGELTTSVSTSAALGVTKTGPAEATAGAELTWAVEVVNAGPSDALDVVVTDSLPDAVGFVSATDGGTEADGVVTWPAVDVAAGDTLQYQVTGRLDPAAPDAVTNVATVSTSTPDDDPADDRAAWDTGVTREADLGVVKSGPGGASAGERITYTVTVTSRGPSDATDVVVVDSLPADVVLVSSTPAATLSGRELSWPTVATVTPADTLTYTLTVDIDPGATGALSNVARVGSSTPDPFSGDDRVAFPTSLGATADLKLVKTGPADAVAGTSLTFDLQVTNGGPSEATDVALTDELPPGFAYVSSTPEGTLVGTRLLWDTVPVVTPADTLDYRLTVSVDPAATGVVTNMAGLTSGTGEADPSDNQDEHDVTVGASADLRAEKVAPGTAVVGDEIVDTIRVVNGGPSAAAGVVVTDSLPVELAFVGASDGGTYDGGTRTVTWPTVSALPEADTLLRTVTVSVVSAGNATDRARVEATTADPDETDNTMEATTSVSGLADLVVTKSGPASVVAGEAMSWTVLVENAGPSPATGVAVTDTLPAAGVVFDSASANETVAAGVVSWPAIPTLTSGADTTFTVYVTVDPSATGSLRNAAAAVAPVDDPTPGDATDAVTTTVSASADLRAEKVVPATATAGDQIVDTVRAVNGGPSDATDVVVTDSLPEGLTFVGASDGGTYASATRTVTWPTVSTLPEGDTVLRTVTVDVTSGGDLIDRARVRATTADPDGSNDAAEATTTAAASADLRAEKVAPATAVVGQQIVDTVRAVNGGPSGATDVVVTDSLPAGLTFVAASDGGTYDAGTRTVTWPTVTTLPAADTVLRTVTAAVASSGDLTDRARVTSATADPDASNDAAEATTTAAPSADLVVTKTAPGTVVAGEAMSWTVLVENAGPSAATSVAVTDTLPAAGVAFDSASASGTVTAGVVSWPAIPSLASGADTTFTVYVTVDPSATGSLRNAAAATSSVADPTPADATDAVTTAVSSSADLRVEKVVPATATAGDDVVDTVRVVNGGPSDATDVVVTDSLPDGVAFVSASDGGTYDGGTRTVTWPTVATLPEADTLLRTVTVALAASGDVTDRARATAATADPDGSNDSADGTTNVTPLADLVVTKSGPATVVAGEAMSWTVLVENAGPSAATSVAVTDTLPAAGVVFDSASANETVAAGVVSWPAIPTLASGADTTFTVYVTVDPGATGSLRNAAAAASPVDDPTPGDATDAVTTTVRVPADLRAEKVVPATGKAGEDVVDTVRVVNGGPNDATDVVVTDSLPDGVTFVSASDGGTYAAATRTVTWPTVATLPEADTLLRTVTVTLATDGDVTDRAEVTSSTADLDLANNAAEATTTVSPVADLVVTKTAPATATAGDALTYTVLVENAGPSAATSVAVTDTLPDGIVFDSASANESLTGRVVSWPAIPTLASGADTTFMVYVTLDAAASGTLRNAAAAVSPVEDPTPGDATDGASTDVNPGPDVRAEKAVPATAVIGEQIVDTVRAVNAGPGDATDVVLTDSLPAGVDFVSASDGGSYAAGTRTVTWPTVATLPEGDTILRSVTVSVTAGGSLTDRARVTTGTADGDPGNNTTEATTTVSSSADLRAEKVVPATAVVGQQIVDTVRAVNGGPSDATDVVVTDSLPEGLTFVAASDGGTYDAGTRTVTWPTVTTLPAADTVLRTVTVEVAATGSHTDRARVTSATADPDGSNDTAEGTTSVSASADLVVTKTAPATVVAGEAMSWTVLVANAGPNAATSVAVTDTLPAPGVVFDSASANETVAAGVVSWPAIPSLASGADTTFTVYVTVDPSATGPLRNAAAAVSPVDDPTPGDATDAATTTVSSSADLRAEKVVPATALVGEEIVDTVRVVNGGPSDATDVVVTDSLPDALTFVSASDGGTYDAGTRTVTWPTVTSLPAADTVLRTVTAGVASSGDATDRARVTSATPDPDGSNDTVEETTAVSPLADLVVTKSGPASVVAGEAMSWTVLVANAGPDAATSVAVTDTLPATEVVFDSASANETVAAGVVSWPAIPSLASGADTTFTVYVTVDPTATGPLRNAAAATSPVTDPTPGDATDAVTTTVSASADLRVEKVVPATATVGEQIVDTVVVTNDGPSEATAVLVKDSLPDGVDFVGASNGGSYDGTSRTVSWPTMGALAPGVTRRRSVTVQVTAVGSPTNRANVSSDTPDPDPANDTVEATTSVAEAPQPPQEGLLPAVARRPGTEGPTPGRGAPGGSYGAGPARPATGGTGPAAVPHGSTKYASTGDPMADGHEDRDQKRQVHRPSEGEVPLVYWEEPSLLRRMADRLLAAVGAEEDSTDSARPVVPDAAGTAADAPDTDDRSAAGNEAPRLDDAPSPADDTPLETERSTLQMLPGRLEPVDPRVVRQEIRFLNTPRPDRGVTLGWDPGRPPYHVMLDHPSVEPMHARMRFRDGAWWIETLSRRTPVVVNGERVSVDDDARLLRDRDRIRLGEAEFVFRIP